MSSDKPDLANPQRRQWLGGLAAIGVVGGLVGYEQWTGKLSRWNIPIKLYYPGMQAGHVLRDATPLPAPSIQQSHAVVIVGSGVAGLFAAWRLKQLGVNDVILIEGPEWGGNAAGGEFADSSYELKYPRGAHYLPLPSLESSHVRELLHDMGVLLDDPKADAPQYLETALVFAPEERVWDQGVWQEGVLPTDHMSVSERIEVDRFFSYIEALKNTHGQDGRRVFTVPISAASTDPQWRVLDQVSFKQWFESQGYQSSYLAWYLDYACRDDYGIGWSGTSAWAGLHYFASRNGHATLNGEIHSGVMLTWPNGLQPLIDFMASHLDARQRLSGLATRVEEQANGQVLVDVYKEGRILQITAQQVICATPLHVAAKIAPALKTRGYDHMQHQLHHAPWQIASFLFEQAPVEPSGVFLAWESLLARTEGLGFVNSTHQYIRRNPYGQTVLTTYYAYTDTDASRVRQMLTSRDTDALFEIASRDLKEVYGRLWHKTLKEIEITVRGHAMSSPTVGFLSNAGLQALRDSAALPARVHFAHADLSGYSVFEEAAWWGDVAARNVAVSLKHFQTQSQVSDTLL